MPGPVPDRVRRETDWSTSTEPSERAGTEGRNGGAGISSTND